MFVTRTDSDICIALIKKCGNTSIHEWVMSNRKGREITNAQAANYKLAIAFFRNPIERTRSLFSHLRRVICDFGGETDILPAKDIYIEGRGVQGDYEAFIDNILVSNEDHRNTQVDLVSENGVFIPNRLHRLDDLNDVCESYFEGVLPWTHRYSRYKGVDESYRASELRQIYANDLTIWNAIPAGGMLEGAELADLVRSL